MANLIAKTRPNSDETRQGYVRRMVEYVRGAAILDPSQEIPLDTSLLDAGIFDSFGIVEMLTFLEAEFDLAIPDEDITKDKLGSIRKIATYLDQHKRR